MVAFPSAVPAMVERDEQGCEAVFATQSRLRRLRILICSFRVFSLGFDYVRDFGLIEFEITNVIRWNAMPKSNLAQREEEKQSVGSVVVAKNIALQHVQNRAFKDSFDQRQLQRSDKMPWLTVHQSYCGREALAKWEALPKFGGFEGFYPDRRGRSAAMRY